MSEARIAQTLRELVGPGPVYLDDGTVDAIEDDDDHGHLLTVTLQPSGRQIVAIPTYPAWAGEGGILVPFEEGQAVLVVMPDGDPNRAYALPAGIPSQGAALPDGWVADRVWIQHSGGTEVRQAAGDTVEPVLLGTLEARLAAVLGELKNGLATAAGGSVPLTPTLDTLVTDLEANAFSAEALKSS